MEPSESGSVDEIDRFVPSGVRAALEERYWYPIERATAAEAFLADEEFYADSGEHPGTFSDHGIVHVRDVARRAAQLAERLDGTLLRHRSPEGLRFVQACAVLMAYLHDIGMVAATPAGRRVHAQFAAQTALGTGFDDLAAALWATGAGGLRARIDDLLVRSSSPVPGELVLREVLALSVGHSKSAVPAPLLDDPTALRQLMLRAAFTTLDAQAGRARQALWTEPRDRVCVTPAAARYADVDRDAFAWLVDDRPVARAFVADVVDAVRVLRAADALRQRGTTQRTSAGYELCVDRRSGQAVLALRSRDSRFAALVWTNNHLNVGEANLRIADLGRDGSLRVGFHRGRFTDPGAAERVVRATVEVVADIEADVLGSFALLADQGGTGRVEIVAPPDHPGFAELVAAGLREEHARLDGRVEVVEEPHPAPGPERAAWRARAVARAAIDPQVAGWWDELAARGLRVDAIDRRRALRGAAQVLLRAGEEVLAPGTEASVVLVPLGEGLRVVPVGGYEPAILHPWLPVGVTGVVRGAERNATVVAEQELDVLAIPADTYLTEWFRPYAPAELRPVWQRWLALEGAGQTSHG